MKYTATVIKGKGRGLDLGCPTATLDIQSKVNLSEGVYYGKTQYKHKIYNSMVIISAGSTKMETWLYGFEGNLYGEELTVEVGKKFSELAHVNNQRDLHDKIKKDVGMVTKLWIKRWAINQF